MVIGSEQVHLYCNAAIQDEDQKMAHQEFSHIPLPSQAVLDAAMRNARAERAEAASQVFTWVGRAVRRLFTATKVSPLETGALTR